MSETRQQIDSTAVRVTFFEDRAEVARKARCRVQKGASWVAVRGVSAVVDDPTVVATVSDIRGAIRDDIRDAARVIAARVIAARVVRRVRHVPAASPGEVEALEAAFLQAARARQGAEDALRRAQALEGRCAALFDTLLQAVQRVPLVSDEAGGEPEWRAGFAEIDEAGRAALDQVSACQAALLAAREEEARAGLRLGEARKVQPLHETEVEVQIEAQAEGEVEIDLTYRTPCALWRPEHVAQLVSRTEGEKTVHEIALRTLATVWQRTGEAWRDVECRFSTARPAQSAQAPLLSDDVLESRRKTDAERGRVVVEAREQAIAVAGLQRGARAVDEMPGVEDGGEPLWLRAPRPATIPGDGQPCRVEISEAVLPCQVDLVSFPERSEAVFVRATATHQGDAPILAGPVRLLRGSETVGSGRLLFVARGEPFELGFGPDDGLRVRREVEEARDTSILGTQKITRTVRVFLSNLSGAPRRLTLTERVPVSEVEDLKVAVTAATGARPREQADPDGMIRFDVTIEGRGQRELQLTYRIEAAAKVHLPF